MAHHHCCSSDAQRAAYPVVNLGPGAKWIKSLTRSRLNNFNGGHFSDVNLSSVLFTHRIDNAEHVKLQVWSAPGMTKPSFEEAIKQKFKPANKGDSFGPSWTNHWFKVSLIIPNYWLQYERVQFEFDPGCEAMIFSTDGVPLQGITGGYGGDRRVEYIIPREACERGQHDIVIESSCNGMFGVPIAGDIVAPPDMNKYFQLASADLVVPNQNAWRLLWDFTTLQEIVSTLPGNTPLQNQALVVANEIMNVFQKGDAANIQQARDLAAQFFGAGWEAKGAGIYREGAPKPQIWGIGYCHIDLAWLWPYRVSEQKTARSWSTQVDLMERYPEHRFIGSQAQQFLWLEKLYPPLFERVKAKVMSGQFQLVGGSWVENDANMPSGEGLVRQFLFGQRYYQSRFGKRCDTSWLPDSFGLTGALPQLIRGAGMNNFFTQKLSWNNINVFPHSTFNWVGIDGTQVLCHMTPVDTYTAQATVGDINKGVTNHKNLESSDTALLVFGNGDGGGGPLPKMLENLRRIRAVANTHREMPTVDMGHCVEDYFEDVLRGTSGGKTLPNWHGELYLEFHRGTYTSHGSIKKGNRKAEILLRDVEHLATYASFHNRSKPSYVYPKKIIDGLWEKVLLNQFHDVLPGSSIGMVYDDAEALYSEVQKVGGELLEEAFEVICPGSTALSRGLELNVSEISDKLVAFNTTPFPRMEVVKIPLISGKSQLAETVLQIAGDGSGLAVVKSTEAGGACSLLAKPSDVLMPVDAYTNGSDHFVLRNARVQLTISKGRITSLLDVKLGRELIYPGQTGGLVIFEDRPNYWDAWDVEIHHLETARPLEFSKVSLVAVGPLRAVVAAEVKYGKSTVRVNISLDAVTATHKPGSRSMFIFDADVDWHERHEILKFELPLNIHSDSATYETQFGHVQRPTHKNTTWDAAKFEVCGHKFADLSEYGYGVAILSESKYGFSCQGNVLRISLLRAATAPDAEQDQGKHTFAWAVLPHACHFLDSDVPIAAYLFNSPLHVRHVTGTSEPLTASRPLFVVDGAPNVILETIKRGEDDDFEKKTGGATSIVLRLYEALGGHAKAQLRLPRHIPIARVHLTNLLEDDCGDDLRLTRSENGESVAVMLNFRGFEVKTVKLVLGAAGGKVEEQSGLEGWVDVDQKRLSV